MSNEFQGVIRTYLPGWSEDHTFNEDLLQALIQYCVTWDIVMVEGSTFNDYLTAVLTDADCTYQHLLDNPSILNPIGG